MKTKLIIPVLCALSFMFTACAKDELSGTDVTTTIASKYAIQELMIDGHFKVYMGKNNTELKYVTDGNLLDKVKVKQDLYTVSAADYYYLGLRKKYYTQIYIPNSAQTTLKKITLKEDAVLYPEYQLTKGDLYVTLTYNAQLGDSSHKLILSGNQELHVDLSGNSKLYVSIPSTDKVMITGKIERTGNLIVSGRPYYYEVEDASNPEKYY